MVLESEWKYDTPKKLNIVNISLRYNSGTNHEMNMENYGGMICWTPRSRSII